MQVMLIISVKAAANMALDSNFFSKGKQGYPFALIDMLCLAAPAD